MSVKLKGDGEKRIPFQELAPEQQLLKIYDTLRDELTGTLGFKKEEAKNIVDKLKWASKGMLEGSKLDPTYFNIPELSEEARLEALTGIMKNFKAKVLSHKGEKEALKAQYEKFNIDPKCEMPRDVTYPLVLDALKGLLDHVNGEHAPVRATTQ